MSLKVDEPSTGDMRHDGTKMSLKVDEPSTGDMRHDGEVDEDKNEFESG